MAQFKKRLFLVDVSSMFFRAFYAIRPLTSPTGVPVNAVYGFLTMALKLLREVRPDAIAFCFDRPEPSFRKELDERYKANRTEMPEDLVPQIPLIRRLSEALGVACVDVKGFEADDLIGSFTRLGVQEGFDVVIVSGDKDFAQLVSERVSLYDTMKEATMGPREVTEKWGILPSQMIDYLSIVGDTSDNVRGVAGIGPKGAQKLLAEYGSLEKIYQNIDAIKPDGVKKKLEASREEAFLAQKLVSIVTDVPISVPLDQCRLKPVEQTVLQPLLEELGFKSLQRTLFGQAATPAESSVEPKVAQLDPQKEVASVPIETTQKLSLNDLIKPASESQKLVNRSVESLPPVESRLQPGPFVPQIETSIEEFLQLLKKSENADEIWILYNERGLSLAVGAEPKELFVLHGDPLLLKMGLNGRRLSGFALKDLAHRFELSQFEVAWDAQLAAYVEHAGAVESLHDLFLKYLALPLPDLATPSQFLGWQLALRRELQHRLELNRGLRVYKELEQPLAPILFQMEKIGIEIDVQKFKAMGSELATELKIEEAEIFKLAGENFNIASPKQLAVVLFEKMGLPPGKKTKTGFSTDNEVLVQLEHPIAAKLLNWRELAKLKSTYVDAIPTLADSADRIHTTFNQALTSTGRLSSQNPNLQNIPIRTERGAKIRNAFQASLGKRLFCVDYSQIELRILAHITADPGLVQAFESNHDIHSATASEVFEVELKQVTTEMRRQAKAINFGLAYGQGAFGLAETLGISRTEATRIIERYFQRFPKVQEYMHEAVVVAKKQGFVETVLGRRRYLPELTAGNQMLRKFGERAAINAPIQGTASDLVKKAMIDIDRLTVKSAEKFAGLTMLLQVHDELIFEFDATVSFESLEVIRKAMETVEPLRVPLLANAEIGKSWGETSDFTEENFQALNF